MTNHYLPRFTIYEKTEMELLQLGICLELLVFGLLFFPVCALCVLLLLIRAVWGANVHFKYALVLDMEPGASCMLTT